MIAPQQQRLDDVRRAGPTVSAKRLPSDLDAKNFERISTLQVHHRGPSEADVTEGSCGIWERLHYDWSDPNRVVMATTDSNVWGGRSGHTYTFTRLADGTTKLDAVVVREGKNFKGRMLGFVLGTIGKRVLEKAFANTIQAIEARNGVAGRSGPWLTRSRRTIEEGGHT